MSKKSPNVIFKSKFCLALTSRDNNNSSLNYKEQRLKDVDDMIDYFSDERKKAVNMFEYFMGHTRGKKYNLVLENGSYATKKDIKRIKNEYKKYIENSNLWKGVISFKKEYLDENIDLKTLEDKIAKEVLPQFLKYCGFKDIKNMSYVFSIHTNRKHQPHIHFAFIEKKPNFLYCDNKINYRRKGKINLDEQNYLKRLVELVIEREKCYTPCLKKTNEDIDYLKSYFKPTEKNYILNNINDIYLEEDILKLGELLKKYRENHNQLSSKIKYNSIKDDKIGKEIKILTKKIKKYLFNDESSELYNSRNDINNDIKKLNDYFDNLNKNNNVSEIIKDNSITNKKQDYIDNYIYNSIVNHAIYKYEHIAYIVKNKKYNDVITIDDLIQEIAFQNSKKKYLNDKDMRKHILDNYFKYNDKISKFPCKSEMEKAFKNINYKLEQASQEFSKLFNYDDKIM